MRSLGATLVLLAACQGARPAAAQRVPGEGILELHPRPDIERLLWRTPELADWTPAALATLPHTPEILARMVLEPDVPALITNHYAAFRPLDLAMYSLWLALQLDLEPDGAALVTITTQWRGQVIFHLARLLLHRWEGKEWAGGVARDAREQPDVHAKARAIFEHRLPLDWPILSAVLSRARPPLSDEQRKKLRILLPRITPAAIAELGRAWPDLAPAVRQALHADLHAGLPASDPRSRLVEKLGLPATSASRPGPAGQSPPAARSRGRDAPPPVIPERPTTDWRLWALAAAGLVVFLGWLRAVARARVAAVILLLLLSTVTDAQDLFDPGTTKYPDLEKLLAQEAPLLEPPITPLKLARLVTTPRLLAELVMREDAASNLARGVRGNRRKAGYLYGLFLALHVGFILSEEELNHMARYDLEPRMYAARLILARQWPQNETYQYLLRTAAYTDEVKKLGTEILLLRMPTDRDILGEIARAARADTEVTPGRVARLGAMWHRLDDTGRAYLKENAGSLPPLIARLVELRGIPAEGPRPPR